jgi:hypothetical protein
MLHGAATPCAPGKDPVTLAIRHRGKFLRVLCADRPNIHSVKFLLVKPAATSEEGDQACEPKGGSNLS